MISVCFWFIQVKLPNLGKDQDEVNRKIERLRRKRDREAVSSVGRDSRKRSRKTADSSSISDVSGESDMSASY